MGSFWRNSVVFLVALLAVGLQLLLKDPIKLGLGLGKTFQPLSDFPFTCRRVEHPRLQSCEDMYLHEEARTLFLACSDVLARQRWMPNAQHFNISGRSTQDAVIALDIDKPTSDGGYELRVLSTPGFTGTAGDGLLHLSGLTIVPSSSSSTGSVDLLLAHNRPPVDPVTGALLEEVPMGGNATIEVFRHTLSSSEMYHDRTIAHAGISTPNNIAALSSDEFYFTNDSGDKKIGVASYLSWLLGQGDVSHCTVQKGKEPHCQRVSTGHKMPNGLTYGSDGLIYVPSAMAGGVQVYRPSSSDSPTLEKLADIPIPYAIDNLSLDSNGDIWAAVFPRGIEIMQASEDPYGARVKSAAVRIRKDGRGGYTWEKVVEDGNAVVLPGATTVVHDVKTGRLFFSGITAPFIAVCEPMLV